MPLESRRRQFVFCDCAYKPSFSVVLYKVVKSFFNTIDEKITTNGLQSFQIIWIFLKTIYRARDCVIIEGLL